MKKNSERCRGEIQSGTNDITNTNDITKAKEIRHNDITKTNELRHK
jgi:hypothetical protein